MSNPTNETKSETQPENKSETKPTETKSETNPQTNPSPQTPQQTKKPKYTHPVYIYKDGEIKAEEHPAGPPFFIKEKHIAFLKAVLDRPAGGKHSSKDNGKAVMLSHLICAFDILGVLDEVIKDKKPYIDWIYNLQLVPQDDENITHSGFMGGVHEGYKFGEKSRKVNKHHCTNIIVTFYCMIALLTLGDDFSRIDKKAFLTAIRALQQKDGSFSGTALEKTKDVRYSYCALAVCAFLNDFSGIDTEKAAEWILSCQTYEGGFGQEPGAEAHSGYTYCALSALAILKKLDKIPNKTRLMQWLFERQFEGFNGRPMKHEDTCYSFWVVGSMAALGCHHLIDSEKLTQFVYLNQNEEMGGIAKLQLTLSKPDLMHTYNALRGLALIGHEGLLPVESVLGVTYRALGKQYKK